MVHRRQSPVHTVGCAYVSRSLLTIIDLVIELFWQAYRSAQPSCSTAATRSLHLLTAARISATQLLASGAKSKRSTITLPLTLTICTRTHTHTPQRVNAQVKNIGRRKDRAAQSLSACRMNVMILRCGS